MITEVVFVCSPSTVNTANGSGNPAVRVVSNADLLNTSRFVNPSAAITTNQNHQSMVSVLVTRTLRGLSLLAAHPSKKWDILRICGHGDDDVGQVKELDPAKNGRPPAVGIETRTNDSSNKSLTAKRVTCRW